MQFTFQHVSFLVRNSETLSIKLAILPYFQAFKEKEDALVEESRFFLSYNKYLLVIKSLETFELIQTTTIKTKNVATREWCNNKYRVNKPI